MGYRDRHISGIHENIVMLELKRREYKVYTGKWDEREIDFVAEKGAERIYVQVAFRIEGKSTIDRKFRPLLETRDHCRKYVVTMDELWRDNIEGIKHINIADFLLLENY